MTIEERAIAFALKEIHCKSAEELECWGTEVAKKAFEEIRNDYIRIATEQKAIDEDAIHAIVEEEVLRAIQKQKAIDDAERKSLVEKVIWLIEDSYYDTTLWTHDELINNINEDLDSRAEELKKMFG